MEELAAHSLQISYLKHRAGLSILQNFFKSAGFTMVSRIGSSSVLNSGGPSPLAGLFTDGIFMFPLTSPRNSSSFNKIKFKITN